MLKGEFADLTTAYMQSKTVENLADEKSIIGKKNVISNRAPTAVEDPVGGHRNSNYCNTVVDFKSI